MRKLMAAFDDESDDDAGVPVRPTTKQTSTTQSANATRTIDASKDGNQSSDEEDEPVLKPRGRLAARMGGAAPPIQEESSSEDEDVYQTIRRDLMASKKAPSIDKSPVKTSHTIETARTQIPQPSPPRKRLANRASTPAVSARSESPGLFMSPAPEQRRSVDDKSNHSSDSDSDLPADPSASSRLRDLVNRRRAERLAREQAEKEVEEENATNGQAPLSDMFNDEDTRDEVTERRLTQSARPTRKASKKALEEMNRETQRIKRNMQLTHQAKVKKRFTPQDFLSAFNRPKTSSGLANVTNAADVTSSSPPPEPFSEAGADKDRDTPPSSPPSIDDSLKPTLEQPVGMAALEESDEELPTLQEVLTQPRKTVEKGKAPVRQLPIESKSIPIRKVHVKIPTHNRLNRYNNDNDDDLEIIHDPLAIFNNIPKTQTTEGRTMLMLRHLAQLTGNGDRIRSKKGQKPSISPQQLDLQLRQRAREIANQERAARLADLRAKGIVVLTEEEREREQMQIEDMLGKAREEAEKLRKQEKATAKANGEDVGLSSDESDDGDYVGSDEEVKAPAEEEDAEDEDDIEISGSEEEDTVDHDMIDAEAGEEDQDEPKEAEEQAQDDELQLPKSRRVRRKHVIEDDEDEDEPVTQQTSGDGINDELAAAFGFGQAPSAPMGMSQMFAGTMDDTQASDMISQDQDSLEMLRHIPPSAPMPSMQFLDDSQDAVADSQVDATQTQANEPTQQMDLKFPQPSADSPVVMSQFSQIPDPSQDVGFDPNLTPLADRAHAPPSTVDTVMLGVPESPVPQRRGRLIRRSEVVQEDEEETVPSSAPAAVERASDAFSVMRQAAKKPAQPDFDKQKSNAKGMVDEQAEESEDEYRGLGGASDDEDAGSGDEDDKQMIDETDVKVDERQLAALYAEKSREQDEAQTSKLYKDLMSGNLRRKRGNNAFELDSDEDDQVVERRRRRQREEARKRKLLLQDETLGKLGSNDKKEAFLRAIEDRDEADDVDFLDGLDVDDDGAEMVDSQQQPSASQPAASPTGNEEQPNSLKRSADSLDLSQSSQQAQPLQKKKSLAASSLRRSGLSDTFRKPKSLAEVRDSLSFLIDDPSNAELASEILLSSDEEREVRALSSEPRAPASARRVPAKDSIIDRLTLKKQASTLAETSDASNLAFSSLSQSAKGSFSFKPASLLRKATTNTSFSNENRPPIALNREGSSGIRNGGSKKSSINYQAREAERQEIVQKAAKRREENVRKIAGLRRKAGGALGALGRVGGGFE
jgi:mediator of replication checkpoint protein 1